MQFERRCQLNRRATENSEAAAKRVAGLREAEVADAHEAAGQQVEEEAPQELIERQSQKPLLVGMCGVAPAEGDVALLESNQPAVRDGNAMRVSTEIAQRVLRAAERRLGINDPVVTE